MIALVGYRSERDPRPRPATITWDALAARLAKPRVATCSLATCPGRTCPDKRGPAWSPATLAPGTTRCDDAVIAVGALVLDIDHVPTDADLAAIVERLAPYRRILHATHSDRPGDRCARAVLELSRSATRDEWPAVWSGAIDVLGVAVDRRCADRSRIYYAPSCPRDAGYYYCTGDGAAIDVDDMIACAAARPSERPEKSRVPIALDEVPDVYAALAALDQADVLERISGSQLVRGERIAIAPPDDRGRRRIVIDGRPTRGYVDARGEIVHMPTRTPPDGGPLVSTWCRYYSHDDRSIRELLCVLVPELARFARGRHRTSRLGPSPIDLRGDER